MPPGRDSPIRRVARRAMAWAGFQPEVDHVTLRWSDPWTPQRVNRVPRCHPRSPGEGWLGVGPPFENPSTHGVRGRRTTHNQKIPEGAESLGVLGVGRKLQNLHANTL